MTKRKSRLHSLTWAVSTTHERRLTKSMDQDRLKKSRCNPKLKFLAEVLLFWLFTCLPINIVTFYLIMTSPEYHHLDTVATANGTTAAVDIGCIDPGKCWLV